MSYFTIFIFAKWGIVIPIGTAVKHYEPWLFLAPARRVSVRIWAILASSTSRCMNLGYFRCQFNRYCESVPVQPVSVRKRATFGAISASRCTYLGYFRRHPGQPLYEPGLFSAPSRPCRCTNLGYFRRQLGQSRVVSLQCRPESCQPRFLQPL